MWFSNNKDNEKDYPKTRTRTIEESEKYHRYKITLNYCSGGVQKIVHEAKQIPKEGQFEVSEKSPEESRISNYGPLRHLNIPEKSKGEVVNMENVESFSYEKVRSWKVTVTEEFREKKKSANSLRWVFDETVQTNVEIEKVEN